MDFLNKLLAGFVATFKAKNPKVFALIVSVLLIGFVAIQVLVGQGAIEASSMTTQILQYIDIAMLALVGSKTAPYLKEYLGGDQVAAQSLVDDWFTGLLDGFKVKSPVAFGVLAVALLTSFVGIHYSLQFKLIPEGSTATFLEIVSYIELAGLILLGSRTGQYVAEHPPGGEVEAKSINRSLYFD